ncbi:peptidylprolyl isomerase [Marinomonas epiphytica]
MYKLIAIWAVLFTFSLPAQATEVTISTDKGDIRVELFTEQVPATVDNFLRYVDEGFYSGTIFHRVIRGFMVQGGGFDKNMSRKTTHNSVPYEGYNSPNNVRGTIAMARTADPDSATSQFFINHVDNPFLNHGARGGPGYTTFGKVIAGMEVVDDIAATPTKTIGPYQNVPSDTITILSIKRVD